MAKDLEMDLEERLNLFRCTMGFQGISDSELEKIAHDASVESFETGEAIFFEEDPCEAIRVVAEGLVRNLMQSQGCFSKLLSRDGLLPLTPGL